MKNLALLFFAVFALNLLGEFHSGHCDETSRAQGPWGDHGRESAWISVLAGDVDANAHDGCPHFCHFGHCGHLVIGQPIGIRYCAEVSQDWRVADQWPLWRSLSPLLRPPIS